MAPKRIYCPKCNSTNLEALVHGYATYEVLGIRDDKLVLKREPIETGDDDGLDETLKCLDCDTETHVDQFGVKHGAFRIQGPARGA